MSEKSEKKKIICIGGATASGKTSLAFDMMNKNNGEIISADSRQIYRNIPIFSGIEPREKNLHLVGFLDETETFSAGDFVKLANEKIEQIWEKGKTPIIVGGTSFYFKSLLYKNFLPKVDRDEELRKSLEGKTADELLQILKNLDPERAENIDQKNIPRIIRSIEIATKLGKVPKAEEQIRDDCEIEFNWIHIDRELQKEKIAQNFTNRMKKGFLNEAQKLKKSLKNSGMNQEQIEKKFFDLGLAYKHIFKLWSGEINESEFINLGILEEQKYAKRQNTYLKKFFNELPKEVNKKKVC